MRVLNPAVLVPVVASCAIAYAQEDIDFGTDSHPSIDDGICQDARFRGEKTQGRDGNPFETHQDATDCRTLYEGGEIRCFSRRRCADESRETQFRILDVRRSIVVDLSGGLAESDRAMIYVEPQQTRGPMVFTAVNGVEVEDKEIILLPPGTHQFEVSWESPPSWLLIALGSENSARYRRRASRSAVDSSSADSLASAMRQAFTASGVQHFEVALNSGKTYRIHPTEFLVADESLVEFPIVRGAGAEVEYSQGTSTLAIWVVDVDTGEIVLDQRDNYPVNVETSTNVTEF